MFPRSTSRPSPAPSRGGSDLSLPCPLTPLPAPSRCRYPEAGRQIPPVKAHPRLTLLPGVPRKKTGAQRPLLVQRESINGYDSFLRMPKRPRRPEPQKQHGAGDGDGRAVAGGAGKRRHLGGFDVIISEKSGGMVVFHYGNNIFSGKRFCLDRRFFIQLCS